MTARVDQEQRTSHRRVKPSAGVFGRRLAVLLMTVFVLSTFLQFANGHEAHAQAMPVAAISLDVAHPAAVDGLPCDHLQTSDVDDFCQVADSCPPGVPVAASAVLELPSAGRSEPTRQAFQVSTPPSPHTRPPRVSTNV